MRGSYPIYHAGNRSFQNWPGGEELLAKNNKILFERWGQFEPNIENAKKCDGFINDHELQWLGREAKKRKTIVEIGSWHGKSSRAIGDNLMTDGVLYCVDTWAGSEAEKETNHVSAKWRDGDHAFFEFLQNNFDLIQSGKIIPIRMSSKNAAEFFREKGIQFDMVWIDAGHTYKEVCDDIEFWKHTIKEDGIFCGHDFNGWATVNQAVSDKIKAFTVADETTIWFTDKSNLHFDPPAIFDAFPLNNELDLLELRLSKLYDIVDRFVIVEAKLTHGNKPKELNFNNNLKRFEKYLNKITYIVVEEWDFPSKDSWSIERHQRDSILRGLNGCKGNDIILVSDLDEIPSVEAIKNYKPEDGIMSLSMDLYYYNKNTKAVDKWNEAKIAPYRLVREKTPCGVRYTQAPLIPNGGEHLSYFGSGDIEQVIDKIIKKIEDTAHQEYNKPEFKNRDRIRKSIEDGTDIFGRPQIKFERI
jgi:beta-1,4-mannosyl-glycoprotein beta-1,4-N-acetylglucosaminyltransferase